MECKAILLIEDNPSDVDLTKRALQKSHVANDMLIAEDGQEACDVLFGNGKTGAIKDLPAVVLLDLKLPKLDGLEVLKRIRSNERTKLLPVVILTSSKAEKDIINSYKLGANSYIQKPVDFNQFVEAIKNLGLYWLVLNEPPPLK
jgi:DNA-binding response OmpR family regulator